MKKYTDYLDKMMDLVRNTQCYQRTSRIENWDEAFDTLCSMFFEAREHQKHVFFIGNGGSAAIAAHMTADFMKNGGLHTVGLYDNALTTCMGNDYGYEYVFSKPLEFLMREDDLLVAISSSGNSQNIVNAVEVARSKKGKVITFSGFGEDNKIKRMGDYNLYVPIKHYGMVESIHNLFLQQIVDVLAGDDVV